MESNLVYRVSDSDMYAIHGPALQPGNPNQANTIKNNIFAYGCLGLIEEADPYQYPVPTTASDVVQGFAATDNIYASTGL